MEREKDQNGNKINMDFYNLNTDQWENEDVTLKVALLTIMRSGNEFHDTNHRVSSGCSKRRHLCAVATRTHLEHLEHYYRNSPEVTWNVIFPRQCLCFSAV